VTDADGRSATGTFTIVVLARYDLAGTDIPKGPALILPSRAETPGVRNPSVRQASVARTICSRRWLARARPAPSYLARLKPALLARYGETDPPDRYVADHLIPVELGGHPTSRWNLWPEPRYQARASHALETSLHRKVCAGTLELAAAQRSIVEFKRENG
jgi:hypothetical protein